jgi:hypothetical protein
MKSSLLWDLPDATMRHADWDISDVWNPTAGKPWSCSLQFPYLRRGESMIASSLPFGSTKMGT